MTLASDLAQISTDGGLLHSIIQGPSTATVTTLGGVIPTIANRLAAVGTGAVRGGWVTATAYVLNDVISQSGLWYRCAVAHTSGTFATDLAAVKWVAHNTYTSLCQTANNLSDVASVATARANLDVPQNATMTAAVAAQFPIGSVTMFAGASAPTGYLLCDGSAVSRTTYAALFALIASTYGPGDGSTTFNVPDFRGRFPLGTGTGNQAGASGTGIISGGTALTARARSAWGGEETHVLATGELPAHRHNLLANEAGSLGTGNSDISAGTNVIAKQNNQLNNEKYALAKSPTPLDATLAQSSAVGSGTAHNTMPPFLSMPFIIRAL